jgi:DNA replication protein DnaC
MSEGQRYLTMPKKRLTDPPLNDASRPVFRAAGLTDREITYSLERCVPEVAKIIRRAADQLAKRPELWPVFVGPTGCGKSFASIVLAKIWSGPRVADPDQGIDEEWYQQFRFVTWGDVVRRLTATWAGRSAAETEADVFRDLGERARLLIIDDVGIAGAGPADRSRVWLQDVMDARYRRSTPTILTSNLTLPALCQQIDPRTASRIEGRGIVYDFPDLDYRFLEGAGELAD